jgi:hypothetical protein
VKPITVTLEKSKETKGTYPFDSPDPNAAITSVYVRERERVRRWRGAEAYCAVHKEA